MTINLSPRLRPNASMIINLNLRLNHLRPTMRSTTSGNNSRRQSTRRSRSTSRTRTTIQIIIMIRQLTILNMRIRYTNTRISMNLNDVNMITIQRRKRSLIFRLLSTMINGNNSTPTMDGNSMLTKTRNSRRRSTTFSTTKTGIILRVVILNMSTLINITSTIRHRRVSITIVPNKDIFNTKFRLNGNINIGRTMLVPRGKHINRYQTNRANHGSRDNGRYTRTTRTVNIEVRSTRLLVDETTE